MGIPCVMLVIFMTIYFIGNDGLSGMKMDDASKEAFQEIKNLLDTVVATVCHYIFN